ncbi:MAG TPA: 50S ribosomal protein L25/general stress protein Ctc [Sedimenticola thiotaurini]|uniref:Large ribosomal subunit protein bL25 n=1 Tax=Sedimenticola thiotaurini TaxID=1543721 RepID=A0A831W6C5_9GAMM|nr:50S ribosomal protein L25/general stress protein Ctc [Sedimenticola thiotaurini]
MRETYEINAQLRTDTGKGASRRLRRQGLIPGIVYGAGQDPVMITVAHNELLLQLEHEAFLSSVLDLNLGGTKEQVILKDLQRHPAKPFLLHVDFLRVSAKDKLRTNVPLHFVNEETSVGVKAGGSVSHHITDVEVSCLPGNLPEYIEVDMAALELGGHIQLSDLVLPEGVELVALITGGDDLPVVSIHSGQSGTEEEGEAEEGGEAEETPVE